MSMTTQQKKGRNVRERYGSLSIPEMLELIYILDKAVNPTDDPDKRDKIMFDAGLTKNTKLPKRHYWREPKEII